MKNSNSREDEELDKLNEMLVACRNADKGYATAAQQVDDSQLKFLFESYHRQRQTFAYDLEQHIRTMGGDPKEKTSLAADAHRAWINIKGTMSGHGAEAILEECIRGEKEALEVYETALAKMPFSNDTRLLLLSQAKKIKAACESLQNHLEKFRAA